MNMPQKQAQQKQNLVEEIKSGKIFIYPTDTIYGIGCNALDEKAVARIREIKARDAKPFSIIAPSKSWIYENLEANKELVEKYLPGPYTLLIKKKNLLFLVHVSDNDMLGVRIPDCEFTKQIQEANVPFITTSVNLAAQPFATSIEKIPKEIIEKVDIIVNIGPLTGSPSTLIFSNGKILER